MVSGVDSITAYWELAPAQHAPPRSAWAKAQRWLEGFLLSVPEDALLGDGGATRARVQLGAVALLTFPLAFAWIPAVPLGRWPTLFCVVTGLIAVAWLEASDRVRPHPTALLAGGFLYAGTLGGVAWEMLGAGALRVDPTLALAAVAIGLTLLAVRGDPRLCLAGGAVGVLSVAAFGSAPATFSAGSVGVASVLAAARGRALRRLAILDRVSGALNEAAFERCVRQAHERTRRTGQPFTLASIEFSALTEIRDTHGVALAEALLRWLASRLADGFRATDLIGRTGADELSIVLLDADPEGALRRLDALCRELATIELRRDGLRQPFALRTAYGAAAAPFERLDAAGLQRLAAQRLAAARRRRDL
jgi:diguanylate cyclase (GGDEF)-like protein